MVGRSKAVLVILLLWTGSCTPIPAASQATATVPEIGTSLTATMAATEVPQIRLAKTDEFVFTIPNLEPFSGREGEVRPDWLAWGAETFVALPDGSFWIDDTAASPIRLLHYSSRGQLLQKISLANLVVYPYDLAVAQGSLWVLDVSSQQPKIVEVGMDGTLQSSIDFAKEIRKRGGVLNTNGRFSLSVGGNDELILQSTEGDYEMVNSYGKITARHIDTLNAYGHTYRTGPFNGITGALPIQVDGTLLDIPVNFSMELPLLGFNPDGSFAVAGWGKDSKDQVDHQVRYFSATGELLGIARQRLQMFGKDWNHQLAFGRDGSVYQLVSNPDHSVQILRLGFYDELPAIGSPMLTPTPLAVLQASAPSATGEEQARNALVTFFWHLSRHQYAEAAAYFGADQVEYARERMPDETLGQYWEYICNTVLWCLPVAGITDTQQVSDDKFVFYVVFVQPDGRRFELGACCGGDPAASPSVWQFAYTVKKINGTWKVMRGPMFTP